MSGEEMGPMIGTGPMAINRIITITTKIGVADGGREAEEVEEEEETGGKMSQTS